MTTITGSVAPGPPPSTPGACETVTNVIYSTASFDQTTTVTALDTVFETPSPVTAGPSTSCSSVASFANFYLRATGIVDNPGPLPNEEANIGLSDGLYGALVPDSWSDDYFEEYGTCFLTFATVGQGSASTFSLNNQGWPVANANSFRADVEDQLTNAVMYWDSDSTLEESAGSYDSPICTSVCTPYGTALSCDNAVAANPEKNQWNLCRSSDDPVGANGYLFLTDDFTANGVNCTGVTLLMIEADLG
jgi:hypothetical protein